MLHGKAGYYMSRNRSKRTKQKSIDIKINSHLLKITNWLHARLFLLKAKFSFRLPDFGDNDYIFISQVSRSLQGWTLNLIKNGKENLKEIEITIANTGDGNVSINYKYPSNLEGFIANLVLDVSAHFNISNNIPQNIIDSMEDPETPSEEESSTMELEFFIENTSADQFCDWAIAESKDILGKLFPALGWLLEIQPPKILKQSNYERRIEMEGRLYRHGSRGSALFIPNPPINQQCVYFELRELSSTRLHVLCKANKFAITHFRELLSKIEKNWPETKENIKRFLISRKGESVVPILVSMGPTINIATGEIVPEPEKYYRAEYRFRGTPLQFSAFITNYGKALSAKYRKDIVELISSSNIQAVETKAVFFPVDDLEPEHQSGVFGEIGVQSLHDQSSLLIVESQRYVWNQVQNTWDIIFSELKRQGWIVSEETSSTSYEIASPPGDVFISYSHKDKEYAHQLAAEFERNGVTPWIDDRIDYGTKWPQVVQDNLNACPIFVVVMSSNAYQSTWVQNEVTYAQMKNKTIFPLLLEGEAWLSLAATQYVDVKTQKMPPQKFFDTITKILEGRGGDIINGKDIITV
jgi:hypothetical protein